MITKMHTALWILAVLAPASVLLQAAQPEAARTTGKVLILDNERTLEGDIERVGQQYRIRRSVGELWVPIENTLRLCETREEAYAFLRSRANLSDGDEHLRLARWCHLQGLRRQALEEATAAVEQRPNHAESLRLLRSLRRAHADASSSPTGKSKEQEEPAENSQPAELSMESLSLFATRVQPILMNACASCHATGRGGAFKLTRTYQPGMSSRKTTQQNLAAVLAQVNQERPLASPLLNKAVSVHGKTGEMSQSPIKNRELAAYRSLEEWVRITVESNPSLHGNAPLPAKPLLVMERTGVAEASPLGEPRVPRQTAADKTAASAETRASNTAAGAEDRAAPLDPFDPVIFNRQMHPQQQR